MIAIVDYGLGNLASVANAFRAVGADVAVTSDPTVIRNSGGVVLPGVGSAAAGMENLRARRLDVPVRDVGTSGTPLLGICLGMQLLFERSEEGDADCLGLLAGTVRRLRGPKVPQIGWNDVHLEPADPWLEINPNPYFYFVHSYVCEPADPKVSVGTTEYGEAFCSAVVQDRIWGMQFHPERSGHTGLQVIRNFVRQSEGSC